MQHSFDNLALHRAALNGDDEGVIKALDAGADINALDPSGRTAIMCAVAGENWETLDASDASFMTAQRLNAICIMVRHPEITLYTLNTAHSSMNGVVLLGIAAWLNLPEVVRLLLTESTGAVSVNGMDTHGVTALMYAARDGNFDVVQILLSHGARPDFRDWNHRTAIQFALEHPRTLWLCETALRRHRLRESKSAGRRLHFDSTNLLDLMDASIPVSDDLVAPPSSIFSKQTSLRLTDTLISSVLSSDIAFLHSLLFSPPLPPQSSASLYPMSVPVLVNLPDGKGWSPIHYCASAEYPSIQILDSLYCAGADMSLFTLYEQHTPLHILAQYAYDDASDPDAMKALVKFTTHLIRDLRAPLSARDSNDETCLHIAAEHGNSFQVLKTFIKCDTSGNVRKIKNSRGLTALEVAKPEFCIAFVEEHASSHVPSITIHPKDSYTSLASFSDKNTAPRLLLDDTSSLTSLSEVDLSASARHLLSNLRLTCPETHHNSDIAHIHHLESLVSEASHINNVLIRRFRERIDAATSEVQSLRLLSEQVVSLGNSVCQAANREMEYRGLHPIRFKRNNRESEDSQLTAVSELKIFKEDLDAEHDYQSVAIQTTPKDQSEHPSNMTIRGRFMTWSTRHEIVDIHAIDSDFNKLPGIWQVDKTDPLDVNSPGNDLQPKQHNKKQRKIQEQLPETPEKKEKAWYGASKIKSWFKRMVVQERPLSPQKITILKDIDENGCNVGKESKQITLALAASESIQIIPSIETTFDIMLCTSHHTLEAAGRDLHRIKQCLDIADNFIELAFGSIDRTERLVIRAIKKRENLIRKLLSLNHSCTGSSKNEEAGSPGMLGYDIKLLTRPSFASISSAYSSHSSTTSLAATMTENDDEDTRMIRRLVLRKIEAQTSGIWDEVDKVIKWLRIVKEVVHGIKRRAYL